MEKEVAFKRRLLMSVDAKDYGAGDDRRQYAFQDALVRVLDRAAARSGLERSTWIKQPAGDGELAILPSEQSELEHVVVDDYVRELANALRAHNHDLRDEARLRLRLAIHYGPFAPAENGYAGQGVLTVARLVDAPPVKETLEAVPAACLAVVLSERIYIDTIVNRHTSLSGDMFRKVRIRNEQFDGAAYLYLPGHDVHAIPLSEVDTVEKSDSDRTEVGAGRYRPAPGEAPPGVNTTINGYVNIPSGVIGVAWNR